MIFSEIYGSYFSVVADIIWKAVHGNLTEKDLFEIVRKKGFGESTLNIPEKLKRAEWPLITEDYKTPIRHEPDMPLTTLEKQWMKAILTDPRAKLFDLNDTGLENVTPLFQRDTIIWFDQYSDGDPFEEEEYIRHFRTILRAVKERRKIEVTFLSNRGKLHRWTCRPDTLEYSLKDDKFRIHISGDRHKNTINLANIRKCRLLEYDSSAKEETSVKSEAERFVLLRIRDDRNALERVMLHFSDLKKETMKISEKEYNMKLFYDSEDETEVLIRILGFGPMIKVTEPESFIRLIRERLGRQKKLW